MSSRSSGRYQSQLFNFVHQQSRRLTEQWENTFRHLQVATKWGVETLIYQVYQLFQSDELAGKRLHTTEPQPKQQLQPQADRPIQQVLETVQKLSFEEPTATPSTTSKSLNLLTFLGAWWSKFIHIQPTTKSSPPQSLAISENVLQRHLPIVRGIATNLENRNLVLVTGDNEILDILTPQQQAKLTDKIVGEVADYWHSWRLAEAKKDMQILPQIDRILAKLTGGNSPNINALAEGNKTTDNIESKYILNSSRVLALLDAAVAKLESNALAPVQHRSQEIIQVAQTQLNIFIYGKDQLESRGKIAVNGDSLKTQTLNIQALIEAALNYFFGDKTSKKIEFRENSGKIRGSELPYNYRKVLSENQEQKLELGAEPWLTWSDLFGKDSESKQIIPSSTIDQAIAFIPAADSPQDELINSKQDWLQKTKSELVLLGRNKLTPNQKQTQSSVSQAGSKTDKKEVDQKPIRQNFEIEAKPDWIETTATSLGYEKHPLEQILAWLDLAILWLEQIFVNMFYFFQGLLRGK